MNSSGATIPCMAGNCLGRIVSDMPVNSKPRERPIIEMLLSAYENGAWKTAALDWVEEREDGAVEVVATRADGIKLALEHTLIQPFVDDKFDSHVFMKAFGRIENNAALVRAERSLDVFIPVRAIPKGYDWSEVGDDLLAWLIANHAGVPQDGDFKYSVPVGRGSKNGCLKLNIILRTTSVPGMKGNCRLGRHSVPGGLETVVEKALRTKIPKLVKASARRRILLLERDQTGITDRDIYQEVVGLSSQFPDLARIDEIWLADTSILSSENCAYFSLMDGRGRVEWLGFDNGALTNRRDDRPLLGPSRREF